MGGARSQKSAGHLTEHPRQQAGQDPQDYHRRIGDQVTGPSAEIVPQSASRVVYVVAEHFLGNVSDPKDDPADQAQDGAEIGDDGNHSEQVGCGVNMAV